MKLWAGKTGIALILIALAPYAYVQYRLRSHNWIPLDAPASLSDGTTTVTADFPTDLTGFDNVSLTFAPTNVDLEECLIGDRLFDACDKIPSGLDLDWSVLASTAHGDETVVAYQRYTPSSFGGSGYVGTVLGTFDARKGYKYRVAIRARQVAPQLRSASPHILIEAGRLYWEQWIIFAQLTLLFAAIIGLPGLVLLIIGILSQRRVMAEMAVTGE